MIGSTSSAGCSRASAVGGSANDGTFADGRHRKHHPYPCEAWGRKARLGDETWETPVLAQVAGIARSTSARWRRSSPPSARAASRSRSTEPGSNAIYDRITVAGPEIVGVRLTQAAYAHGLALALHEQIVMARPTGLEPATFGSGTQRSIH